MQVHAGKNQEKYISGNLNIHTSIRQSLFSIGVPFL
jgi:hypothetical protein